MKSDRYHRLTFSETEYSLWMQTAAIFANSDIVTITWKIIIVHNAIALQHHVTLFENNVDADRSSATVAMSWQQVLMSQDIGKAFRAQAAASVNSY